MSLVIDKAVQAAHTTKWFIWGVITLAIGIDIWWVLNGIKGDTISEVTKAYSYQITVIPFAYGILTGHLFWGHRGEIKYKELRMTVLVILASMLLAADILDLWDMLPIIPVALATPLGRLLWPQAIPESASLFVWKIK